VTAHPAVNAEEQRLVVVVPFLNEAWCLPGLLSSVAGQTRLPDRLVLVDDGSTDGSGDIADDFAGRHDWVTELPADAFETLLGAFDGDPRLGMAGLSLTELGPDGEPVPLRSPRTHVEGATKFHRRACWDAIDPVPAILGWDTLDELKAQLRGWRTQSFEARAGHVLHRRRMGTAGPILRSFRRWGECSWGYGAHPLYVGFYGARLMRRRRPLLVGGLNYWLGWAGAAVRRAPRADPELRAAVRREWLRRVRRRMGNLFTRPLPAPLGIGEDASR
jgi:biofilm PGA synthesis N-glycosyltransferase PgaC